MSDGFRKFMLASEHDRLDLFLAASTRVGTAIQNVEKDFWVCWALHVLYHGLPAGNPRLLFKGGTSLSKAYGLIRRFSEDIDITVFREDLNEPASVEDLEALSGKKRKAKLDAIRDALVGSSVWASHSPSPLAFAKCHGTSQLSPGRNRHSGCSRKQISESSACEPCLGVLPTPTTPGYGQRLLGPKSSFALRCLSCLRASVHR
jgi:hypothetical protein